LNLICDSKLPANIPAEEAGSYFKQLKQDGTDFLYLDLPWEEIEHESSGFYNEAYLAYLRKIILAADKEGICVSVNFRCIVPVWAKTAVNNFSDCYTAAFLHAQRRLKNCNVKSFSIEEMR